MSIAGGARRRHRRVAGLRGGPAPGDEIVAIDDRRDLGFTDLLLKVRLSSQGQVLHFEVKRPGHDGLIGLDIQPRREASADRPTIGISPSHSLEIGDFEPPPGWRTRPTYHGLEGKERESKVDVLVAAGPAGKEPAPLDRQSSSTIACSPGTPTSRSRT